MRLQQGNAGGGSFGAGYGLGTEGDFAGDRCGIGEYIAEPVGKKLGGVYFGVD